MDWAILVFSVPAGLLAADFVSGLAHWLADRVLSEDTPFFGPYFVRPFREHHRDPQGILFHDWVETNGNTCISAAPLLVLALVAVESTPGTGRNAIGAYEALARYRDGQVTTEFPPGTYGYHVQLGVRVRKRSA